MAVATGELIRAMNYVDDINTTLRRICIYIPSMGPEERKRLADVYRDTFANPYKASELGYVDQVIVPEETRRVLIGALKTLEGKRERGPSRKHGNIPL